MIPWELLDRAQTPSGEALTLHRRGHEYVIRVAGQDLMGSRQHGSEEALAQLGCAGLGARRGLRVLVGGLGMGFTARAALDLLGSDAELVIAELIPAVVTWNRTHLAPLAGAPLSDRRAVVEIADVADLIASGRAHFDAILLDVDNGPTAFTSPANRRLYGPSGLARAHASLRPGGVLAVWSAEDDAGFTARLGRAGFAVTVERMSPRHGSGRKGGRRHVVWVARKRD